MNSFLATFLSVTLRCGFQVSLLSNFSPVKVGLSPKGGYFLCICRFILSSFVDSENVVVLEVLMWTPQFSSQDSMLFSVVCILLVSFPAALQAAKSSECRVLKLCLRGLFRVIVDEYFEKNGR